MHSDRIGSICTKSSGIKITPLSVAPFPSKSAQDVFLHNANQHQRWTGLWKHQSPGEGPAQLHLQTPHVLRTNTENPLRKTRLPSVRLPRATRMREGANKAPSALCSSTCSFSLANIQGLGLKPAVLEYSVASITVPRAAACSQGARVSQQHVARRSQ